MQYSVCHHAELLRLSWPISQIALSHAERYSLCFKKKTHCSHDKLGSNNRCGLEHLRPRPMSDTVCHIKKSFSGNPTVLMQQKQCLMWHKESPRSDTDIHSEATKCVCRFGAVGLLFQEIEEIRSWHKGTSALGVHVIMEVEPRYVYLRAVLHYKSSVLLPHSISKARVEVFTLTASVGMRISFSQYWLSIITCFLWLIPKGNG